MHKHCWTLYEKNPEWSICEKCQIVQQRFPMEIPFATFHTQTIKKFNDNPQQDIEDKIFTEQRLKELSPRQQQVCELILEGYTQEETAKKLKKSRTAIEGLYQRAIKVLNASI